MGKSRLEAFSDGVITIISQSNHWQSVRDENLDGA